MQLSYDTRQTERRRAKLEAYARAHVLNDDVFLCPAYAQCRGSHVGDFYEGQLHHVGARYDVAVGRVPFRIAVIGQEYGHAPARVGLDERYKMVMDSGLQSRWFKTEPGYPARKSHMRGTTSVLRLLFKLGLGRDHDAEFLQFVDGTRCHMFDAFALVDYLLCSAVVPGSTSGKSTQTMRRNCQQHFREALDILAPTVIVVQSKDFWPWVSDSFDAVQHMDGPLHEVRLNGTRAFALSFTHPSAHYPSNWGTNESTPYLLDVVAPAVAQVRRELFGGEGSPSA